MVEAAGRVGAANRLPGTLDITSPKSGARRQATFTTPYATLPAPSSPGRSFAGDIAPEEDEVRPGERGGDVERADPERTDHRFPVGRSPEEAVPRGELGAQEVRPDRLSARQSADQLHQQREHESPHHGRGAV